MKRTHALHWESWLLRLALLGTLAFQIATGNKDGATVAGEGFVVSLIPLAVEKLSKTHVPRALDLAFVLGMALQFVSESTKLFELFTYWDKIVHPMLVALTAMIATWLMFGYRDTFRVRMPLHLVAAFGLLLGLSVGAFWEFIEFASDWFGDANLQKSNGDTMTDIIANDIGAFAATLLALWIFTRFFGSRQRDDLGHIARWLAHGPERLASRHGGALGVLFGLGLCGVLFASQWIDRNTSALASGLTPGEGGEWTFPSPDGVTSALSGDWIPDERGMCRVNLEHPKPGSEKMGLLQIQPGSAYGLDGQPFTVQAHYYAERPPIVQGTEMAAGIAFGIRDDRNFLLLEESALHDVLRLNRYVNGKRRDMREQLVRTHGNEWHTLNLTVSGTSVTAGLDGQARFATEAPETAGGVGLWARTAAASCFDEARVQRGPILATAAVPVPAW